MKKLTKLQRAAQELNEAWHPEKPIDIQKSKGDLDFEIGGLVFNTALFIRSQIGNDAKRCAEALLKYLRATLSDQTVDLIMPLFKKTMNFFRLYPN